MDNFSITRCTTARRAFRIACVLMIIGHDSGTTYAQVKGETPGPLPAERTVESIGGKPKETARESENIETRIAELRAQMARTSTIQDYQRGDEARRELGVLLLEAGRYKEALDVYQEPLRSFPVGDPRVEAYNVGYGIAAFHLGLKQESLESLVKGGNAHTSYSYQLLGQLLEDSKKLAEATTAYRKAIAANVRSLPPVTALAASLFEQGKQQEAADVLLRSSPIFGRQMIMQALRSNERFKPLVTYLEASGTEQRLKERSAVTVATPSPATLNRSQAEPRVLKGKDAAPVPVGADGRTALEASRADRLRALVSLRQSVAAARSRPAVDGKAAGYLREQQAQLAELERWAASANVTETEIKAAAQ